MQFFESANIGSTIVSSFTTVAGEVTSAVMGVVPVAIGVAGIYMVVRGGIKMFKGASK